jgi:hypothetical protein
MVAGRAHESSGSVPRASAKVASAIGASVSGEELTSVSERPRLVPWLGSFHGMQGQTMLPGEVDPSGAVLRVLPGPMLHVISRTMVDLLPMDANRAVAMHASEAIRRRIAQLCHRDLDPADLNLTIDQELLSLVAALHEIAGHSCSFLSTPPRSGLCCSHRGAL